MANFKTSPSRSFRIIRSITEFRKYYASLQAGDLVLGLLPLKPGEEIKLVDLVGPSF